jgi:cytidylate kinase
MAKKIAIALDGPAGSGKSTIAKLLACKFNYFYIDTGAMYRAITLKALLQGVDVAATEELTVLAKQTAITLNYLTAGADRILRVYLDGDDVTDAIRNLEVTNNASAVAAVAGVREALVRQQQKMAQRGGVVMDGRDIGTVVLPQAELKVYLTAAVVERGKRRWLELQAKGVRVELAKLIAQIERRDYLDSHREVSPLCQAPDALLLDTTNLSIAEVVERLTKLAVAKGAIENSC